MLFTKIVSRLDMDRRIKWPRLNSILFETRHKSVPPIREHVDEPRRNLSEIGVDETQAFNTAQFRTVQSKHLFLSFHAPFELFHLFDPNYGLEIGEFEVISNRFVVIDTTLRPAKVFKTANAGGDFGVVRHDRSALPGRNDLQRTERKHA